LFEHDDRRAAPRAAHVAGKSKATSIPTTTIAKNKDKMVASKLRVLVRVVVGKEFVWLGNGDL